MRNRDLFLPSLTTLILCGLVWFLSCAHQNRYRDRLQENSDFSQSEEVDTTDDFVASKSPQESDNKLFEEEKSIETEAVPPKAEATRNDFAFQSEFSPDTSAEKLILESSNKKKAPPILVPVPPSSTEFEEDWEIPPLASADPEPSALTLEPADSPTQRPTSGFKTNSAVKTPQVPNTSFMKNGVRLNRFYFVRKGDSAKKVSQLLYRTSSQSKKLTSWNGSNWVPGSMLFYSSPQNPEDEAMQSFYEENQIAAEEYKVEQGDWLSSIARKKLGDFRSWKEIAVANNLESPNSLEAGEVLAIYPQNLGAVKSEKSKNNLVRSGPVKSIAPLGEEPELARALEEAIPVTPEPLAQVQVQPNPAPEPPAQVQAQAQVQLQPPPTPEPQVQPVPEPTTEPESNTATVNWEQLIEQNFVAIIIGAALIILLLALSARKKRLKGKSSNDEETGSEPKTRVSRR